MLGASSHSLFLLLLYEAVYPVLKHCRDFAYLCQPFHKGLVVGGLLHVVVHLHTHQ